MAYASVRSALIPLILLSIAAIISCDRSNTGGSSSVPSPVQAHADASLVHSESDSTDHRPSAWIFKGPGALGEAIVNDSKVNVARAFPDMERGWCDTIADQYKKIYGIIINCDGAKVWAGEAALPKYTSVRIVQTQSETWLLIMQPDD